MNGVSAAGIIFAILAVQAGNDDSRLGYGLAAMSLAFAGICFWVIEAFVSKR